MFLAFASIVAGFIPFHNLVTSDGKPFESHIDWLVAIPSILVGLTGIIIAFFMYKKVNGLPDKVAAGMSYFYKWALP